jgi:3-dehydroquinate synthase
VSSDRKPITIDAPFSVPFVHRLRFTHDVFGDDQQVLADALQPSEAQPARVQFWVDANVAAAHPDLQERINRFCDALQDHIICVGRMETVPGGEDIKNDIHVFEGMLKLFNAADLDRRCYVVIIGGGAVLDAVGFAASIAHRGVRVVRLPTSTLGQGDSGVGVKNGVNLFGKKNWLGSFAVPWAVINDQTLMSTLSDRDFVCGFSESVKVSLLKDPTMFDELCQVARRIRCRDMSAALPMIRRSAQLHLDHITRGGDPFEMLEARPLDFGHWSAHKLEAMSEFRLRHGEAVAIGVAIDTVYSSLTLGLHRTDAERVLRCLIDLGLNTDDPSLSDTATLFDGLEEFRQHLGGRLTLTMLRGIGEPVYVHEVDRGWMPKAIDQVREYVRASGRDER